MSPLYSGYSDCSSLWERTRYEREHEAEQTLSRQFHRQMSYYTFPTQELLLLICRQHGLHAALLAVDALERQGYTKHSLALSDSPSFRSSVPDDRSGTIFTQKSQ